MKPLCQKFGSKRWFQTAEVDVSSYAKENTNRYMRVYRGSQGYSRVYKGLQGITRVYKGLQGIKGDFKGLQRSTGVYKFIELCMETPCWCPSEGHQHGGRKPTETSFTEFCTETENYYSRVLTH